jgi:hypothetical protein
MKRILDIVAVSGLLVAAPAFAGVDVVVQFGTPAPVYVAPAPVYASPVIYRSVPRWRERHFHRDHRAFRDHRWHHDYRGRH